MYSTTGGSRRFAFPAARLRQHGRPAARTEWSRARRPARVATVLGILLVWSTFISPANAQPSEYQIKAAFLFNFVKFTEWPPTAFSGPSSPIVIGVLGDNPFGDALEQVVRNKTLNNRRLEIKLVPALEDAKTCHVLFISGSEKSRLPEIFESLQGATVLTVGEEDRFTETGGMISFFTEANKIRFQINTEEARKSGVRISSKLLSLASRPSG